MPLSGPLRAWEAGALVERQETGTTTLWALTERGQQAAIAGTLLRDPRPVLDIMPAHPEEMNRWQLMRSLELDGWEMKCVDTRRCLRDVRERPYDPTAPDAPKLWWVRPACQNAININMDYLFLLLTGAAHQRRVPHLAHADVYKKFRDPDWKPRAKKQARPTLKPLALDDAWDDPDCHPVRRPPKRARRGPHTRFILQADEPVLELGDRDSDQEDK